MNDSVYGDPLSSPAVRNVSGDYQYEDMTFYYAKDGTDDFSTSIPSKPGTYRVRAVAAATQHLTRRPQKTCLPLSRENSDICYGR